MPPPPSASGSPPGSEEPPAPPELPSTSPSWPGLGFGRVGLDRLGLTQAIGGLALGLIALFSSYDHLTIAGRNIAIPQQWGIPLIAASVAIIFVDAQLASGSRLRAEHRAARAADETDRERHLAREERQRAEQRENEADRERNRAARSRKRQRKGL